MTYMATSSVKKDVEEVLSISLVDDLLHHRSKEVVAVTVGTLRNLLHASSPGEYPATPRQPDIATRILRRLRRDVHSQSSSTETENTHRGNFLVFFV